MSRYNPLRNPSAVHNTVKKPQQKKSSEEGAGTKLTTSPNKKSNR